MAPVVVIVVIFLSAVARSSRTIWYEDWRRWGSTFHEKIGSRRGRRRYR
jgi:hypothetical protein